MPSTIPPRIDCHSDATTDRTTRKKTISDMNSPIKRHMSEPRNAEPCNSERFADASYYKITPVGPNYFVFVLAFGFTYFVETAPDIDASIALAASAFGPLGFKSRYF